MTTSLHTHAGDKKYITDAERDRFLAAAQRAPVVLAHSGPLTRCGSRP